MTETLTMWNEILFADIRLCFNFLFGRLTHKNEKETFPLETEKNISSNNDNDMKFRLFNVYEWSLYRHITVLTIFTYSRNRFLTYCIILPNIKCQVSKAIDKIYGFQNVLGSAVFQRSSVVIKGEHDENF